MNGHCAGGGRRLVANTSVEQCLAAGDMFCISQPLMELLPHYCRQVFQDGKLSLRRRQSLALYIFTPLIKEVWAFHEKSHRSALRQRVA
jgi:hypothetical protein